MYKIVLFKKTNILPQKVSERVEVYSHLNGVGAE